jgi:hypothetical protein
MLLVKPFLPWVIERPVIPIIVVPLYPPLQTLHNSVADGAEARPAGLPAVIFVIQDVKSITFRGSHFSDAGNGASIQQTHV